MINNKNLIVVSFLIVYTCFLAGCTFNNMADDSKATTTLLKTNEINQNNNIQIINNETFLKTLEKYDKDLYKDPRVKEAFSEKKVSINQQYINSNNTYLIVWSNDLGFTSILEIYIKNGDTWDDIYCKSFGLKIDAVKSMENIVNELTFLEITDYKNGAQKVTLLCLDNHSVTTSWEYITLQKDSKQGDSGITQINMYENNSYIIIPGYLKSYILNDETPIIIVHNRYDISTLENNKIINKKTETNDVYYVWNANEHKFLNKDIK